jgi:hypothetical protein
MGSNMKKKDIHFFMNKKQRREEKSLEDEATMLG